QGFSKIGILIPQKLNAHNIDVDELPDDAMKSIQQAGGYSNIQEKIEKIPTQEVKDALNEAFYETAHQAYQPIYLFVAIVSLLIIFIAITFRKYFKEDARIENKQDN